MSKAWVHFEDMLKQSALSRYAVAAMLVLVTLLVRACLDPFLSSRAYYQLYFPAVVLAAYLLGVGPALLAITMASFCGYFLFSQPAFQIKTELRPHLSLLSFAGASAVAVFALSHLRGKLHFLNSEYKRVNALTESQAALFREHAGRVSDHLQLISALLQTHARDEPTPVVSRVLTNAASRTMLISRIHRSFANPHGDEVDFKAFAERLAAAVLDARDRPPLLIFVQGKLKLPLEQATSLALVLVESMNARAGTGVRGAMRITLSEDEGRDGVLRIVEEGDAQTEGRWREMPLLGAIVEQMRGRLVLAADDERAMLHLVFPKDLQSLPTWNPLQPLH